MWAWLERLIGRAEIRQRVREVEERTGGQYREALAQLRGATKEIKQTTSTSLDALKRRVQDSDDLMHQALKRGSRPE